MGKITAIRERRGQRKRINVSLDGKLAFSLEAEVAARESLEVGQELSDSQIEALTRSDHEYRCLEAAYRYLSYRPRSEFEVRERLHRRGFDESSVEGVMAKLKEQGLVDDTTFAQFWKDNREAFSPRSQWLTRLELRQKRVAGDIITQVVAPINDEENAYRAALSKARSLPRCDYQSFHRRLGGYLKRRGFGYAVTNHTVKRMWQELGGRFEDSRLEGSGGY